MRIVLSERDNESVDGLVGEEKTPRKEREKSVSRPRHKNKRMGEGGDEEEEGARVREDDVAWEERK